MNGNLEPEETVMGEVESHRKSAAIMKIVSEDLAKTIASLGWECYDDVAVEVGGTAVYEIDGAGTKWAPLKGTRKYNKDAFIVIKNRSLSPFEPSKAPENK
jgi:hypothetical protein